MRDNSDLFDEIAPSQQAQQSEPIVREPENPENRTAVMKCPACGADMIYDAESGKLLCEHCGTQKEIESKTSEELDFEHLLRIKAFPSAIRAKRN